MGMFRSMQLPFSLLVSDVRAYGKPGEENVIAI